MSPIEKMTDEESPFDKGLSESEIIESAYQSVKDAKFNISVVPLALVEGTYRECAKNLYGENPTQAENFAKQVLPFLILSSAVIEEKSTELILEEVIQTHYQETSLIESEVSGWSQGQREEWLLQLGIIDDELKEKMLAVRNTRNRLVHDPDKHQSIEELEPNSFTFPEVIDACLECVKELDSKAMSFDFSG